MKAGVPDFYLGAVDVRDVAEAHFQAAFNPAAKGRHLTSAEDSSFPEIARMLRNKFGDTYPFPKRNIGVPFRSDHSKVI